LETIELNINGRERTVHCLANATLVEVLREQFQLTGTHVGCDTSQCGACTVHVNGDAVKACTLLAARLNDATITTIEGIAQNEASHPMQKAFNECHGLQCGFCTPGMIMSAVDLVSKGGADSPAAIREGLSGNICRCTGYQNIVAAVVQGAAEMQEQSS
jgi:carbon-monoxide dehydrogenase small subunit